VTFAVVFVALRAWGIYVRRHAFLAVEQGVLTLTAPRRGAKVIARADPAYSAMLVDLRIGNQPGVPYWFVIEGDDRSIEKFSPKVWPDLDRVWAAMGLPVHPGPTSIKAKQMRKQFPGTVGWVTAHPVIFTLVLIAAASAAVGPLRGLSI
jgi:hypothetical protein